ncbi:MAG: glycosyltransferase [Magnetococcales bacterium]|nr:glycosyltransferase [Magnetococcales bacterium]
MTDQAQPPVTLLLAVFNGADFLDAALRSVAGQTFGDFELLVVDDGSSDATPHLLRQWQRREPRLRCLTNPRNLGLTRSLNRGLAEARGRYLARLDADDIAFPERLQKQVAFLEAHPEVGLLGSNCLLLSTEGTPGKPGEVVSGDLAIRWEMLFQNPFFHSAVMWRRSLGLTYDESLPRAQDYDLWVRLLSRTRGANLTEPLVGCRRHDKRISVSHRDQQEEVALGLVQRQYRNLLPGESLSPQEASQLRSLACFVPRRLGEAEWAAMARLIRLFHAFAARYAGGAELSQVRRRLARRLLGMVSPGDIVALWRSGRLGPLLNLAPEMIPQRLLDPLRRRAARHR